MGALKDFYYSLENGYYKVLDKVNNVLPIYKIIDPIDSVVPSFLLLILLAVAGLGAGLYLSTQGVATPPAPDEKTTLVLNVTDALGNPLAGVSVSLATDTKTYELITDARGQLSIELPEGSQVDLLATKDGFESAGKSFVFDGKTPAQTLALTEKTSGLQPAQTGTLNFADPSGKKLTNAMTVKLSCTNPWARFPQDTYTVTNGTLTYVPPENCGTVLVNVDGQGLDQFNGADDDSGIIHLAQTEVRAGGALIQLTPTLDGAKIELRDAAGAYVDEGVASFGEKTFELTPGTYYAMVTDPSGGYADAQSGKFIVYADLTQTVQVVLTKDIQAVLNVKVLDKVSGAAVTGAKVTLKRETGEAMATRTMEAGKAAVTFNMEEKGKYFVEAYHDDYLASADVAVDTGSASKTQPMNVEVRLEKVTPENSGRVEVLVQDEEKLPVVNAKVALYYAQTKFLCEACGTPATDDKGLVKFSGLQPGKYYAYAQKYPATGKSLEQELLVKQATKFTVAMKIGTGTLKVNTRDADGLGVPFADIEVFDATGAKLGTISADDKGVATYLAKADKAVYVKVSKQGLTTWTSRLEQIFADQTIEFNASLLASITGKEPKVLFDGMFDEKNGKVKALAPGQRYKARFSIQVPSQSTLRALTFFIRTGTESTVEKDPWFINNLNVPTATLLRGATWNPPIGNDEQLLTNGDAKWAKISWVKDSGIEPGIYNVEVELKVRQETQLGTALALSYRLQAEDLRGKFVRDPVDSALGDKQNVPAKKELFANTYDKSFATGQAESCANGFCYGERMYDPVDNVYLKPPYQLRVFQKYKFESTITNDSPTVYDSANLRVKITQDGLKTDDSLLINRAQVVNADLASAGETGPKTELNQVGLGNFTQNKSIRTEFELEAKKQGATNLQQSIVSGGGAAFTHLTPVNIFSDQRLTIGVDQDVVPAYLDTRLAVQITFAGGENAGFNVDNALVRLRRRTPDRVETVQVKTTNPTGKAEFIVPASVPGTRLTIEVEKRRFTAEALVLETTDKPIEVKPATLTYTLGLTTNNERDAPLTITSKIPQKLYISKLVLKGEKARGLLNLPTMQNFLSKYTVQQTWVTKSEALTIDVRAAVSALAKLLKEKASVESSLYLELSNESRTATYSFSVPMKADIGLAEKPKVSGCLSIQPNAWKDTTFESKLIKQVTVKNNCLTKAGVPMDLSNLTAMVSWSGDVLGYVELTLNDSASGATPTIVLQKSRPSQLFEAVPADKEYTGTLTFTPMPDSSVLGKTAKFGVILDAEIISDSGPQSIGGDRLDGELLITNLDQCVSLSPDPQIGIRIKRGDEDAQEKFQIDTSKCGNIDVDFRFCDHDDCRGGTMEGGITLDPFEISNAKPDKTYDITVTRQIVPGYYGIPVYARPAGGGWRQIAEYKAIVEGDGFLNLDKYSFFTPPGETDSAVLKNYKYLQKVSVTANDCSWGEVYENMHLERNLEPTYAIYGIPSTIAKTGDWRYINAAYALYKMATAEDCHDNDQTHVLRDYVINLVDAGKKGTGYYLPSDARDIILDKEKLAGSFNLQTANCLDCQGKDPIQTVGVNFQNLGLVEDAPTYTVATLTTTIHHHGGGTGLKKGGVECDNGNFGNYWIGPQDKQGQCAGATDEKYSTPFHLRFQTKTDKLEIPQVDFDTFACNAGVQLGVNGPGALPKTRLNWSWRGAEGITADSCNADNPKGIYCDATQFNIAMVKRLEALEEFLKANNYQFTCPTNKEQEQAATEFNLENASRTVAADAVGISSITGTQSGDDLTLKVTLTNNTQAPADASLTVQVTGSSGTPKSCTIAVSGVNNLTGANSKNGECLVADLADGMYTATAEMGSSSAANMDSGPASFGFVVNVRPQANELAQKTGCAVPRTMETLGGEPGINRFIKADTSVNWTTRVPALAALNKLTTFSALLMADGYSVDFLKDFGEYYTNAAFAEADTSFQNLGVAASGKKYGFNQFYLQNKLAFSRKFEPGVNTIQAGVYEVELAPTFTDDWRFFDDQGNVKGRMGVSLYRVADPVPNSLFYRLPFDGLVGLDKDQFSRQGYGVSFVNLNPTETVRIDNNPVAIISYPDSGSNPQAKVSAAIEKDIKIINSSPQSMGRLLAIESQGTGSFKLTLSPSYATPVMLVMDKKERTSEPFSAFYSLSDKELPINTGTSLTNWNGAGACLNFDGQLVTEAFFHKLDRAATQKDQQFNFQNTYAVDWRKADYAGKVFLRTLFYTPRFMDAILRAEEPKGALSFLTPDESDTKVKLEGISTMEHNRPGRTASDSINSVQDVFDMVKTGSLCLREDGPNVSFFWNPEYVYKQTGLRQSLHEVTQKLEAGTACIGYPVNGPAQAAGQTAGNTP